MKRKASNQTAFQFFKKLGPLKLLSKDPAEPKLTAFIFIAAYCCPHSKSTANAFNLILSKNILVALKCQ